jgi:pyridoxal 5'-phosphate synthase pdxS subunit
MDSIRQLQNTPEEELMAITKELAAPYELVLEVRKLGRLPVVNFAAGGIATPADAALMMQLGAEGIFVGSGIFKSSDPEAIAIAIVKATTHFNDPQIIAEVSKNIGIAMPGLDIKQIPTEELLASRGW